MTTAASVLQGDAFLQFQRKLLNFIASYKIAQENERKAEEEIKQLIADKQQLQIELKAKSEKSENLTARFNEEKKCMVQMFEEKLKRESEIKSKAELHKIALEKNITQLRESVKAYEMERFKLQKQAGAEECRRESFERGKRELLEQLVGVRKEGAEWAEQVSRAVTIGKRIRENVVEVSKRQDVQEKICVGLKRKLCEKEEDIRGLRAELLTQQKNQQEEEVKKRKVEQSEAQLKKEFAKELAKKDNVIEELRLDVEALQNDKQQLRGWLNDSTATIQCQLEDCREVAEDKRQLECQLSEMRDELRAAVRDGCKPEVVARSVGGSSGGGCGGGVRGGGGSEVYMKCGRRQLFVEQQDVAELLGDMVNDCCYLATLSLT